MLLFSLQVQHLREEYNGGERGELICRGLSTLSTTMSYLNIVGISFPPNNSVLQSDSFSYSG